MNQHIIQPPAEVAGSMLTERRAIDRASFISLALTQRRLSRGYRQWAREDERAGKLDAYRRNTTEANRLASDARWYLARAKMMAEPLIDKRIAA